MKSERWEQVDQLLQAALDREPSQRAAFLAEACAGDEALRQEVESLLAMESQAAHFIEAPPEDLAAALVGEQRERSMVGRTLSHYQITALIGAGGMGEVYRAKDTQLGREVAVKILPPQLAENAEALARFKREARAVAALSHPNILAIHDFGSEQGVTYAVMELLEGETLRARLARSALPWREAMEIGAEIAEGLAAAHAKGITHRDLKPENLFLTRAGQVKILDFGLARIKPVAASEAQTLTSTVAETTKPGVVMGTFGYMSPEQVRGETAEAPSDLFSLGIVLYEMVSGQRPFARGNPMETMAAILTAEPPSLAEMGKEVPAEVERIIRHCLAKRASERYPSGRELAVDLRVILSGGRISASVPALTRPRSGQAVWIGMAAVLVISVLLALYLVVWRGQAIDSLAVLPLVNASGDVNMEYLSDGITEGLINSLSQLPQLKRVIAHSTVSSYKGKEIDPRKVGHELNVQAVLTGRVVQQNDTLIVWTELVNVADGARLWGGEYSQKLANLFALQGELAQQISAKLRLALTGEQQKRLTKHYTENTEAYRLYLQGYYYSNRITPDGVKKGIELLNQAVELDPGNALTYVGLAYSYAAASDQILAPSEAMPKVKAAAERALQLDETLGEAHTWLAYVRSRYEWNWVDAEQGYKRALELNPNYAPAHQYYGWHLAEQGRLEEAIAEMTKARELDPLTSWISTNLAWLYRLAGQPDEAIARLRKIIEADPNFIPAHGTLGDAYEQKGMFAEAIAEYLKVAILSGERPETVAALKAAYASSGLRGYWREQLEQWKIEYEQAKQKQGYWDPLGIALAYTRLGEQDLAFAWLEKAYEVRSEGLLALKVDPVLDSLRSDPRFTDLLRRMNLAP